MIQPPDFALFKPYLLRALYEWCCDQGLTPYASVHVDAAVQVPMEFVKDGQITLNISAEATNAFRLTNEGLEFVARFGGTPRQVSVPISHIAAIFARENGDGMVFPPPERLDAIDGPDAPATASSKPSPAAQEKDDKKEPEKPFLRVIK
jgi:stringent starvation protein B